MRIVVTDDLKEILNIAVSVTGYKYKYDTVKNIRASIDFSEYLFLTEETTTESSGSDTPTFISTAVYVGETYTTVKSYNDSGSIYVYARGVIEFLDGSVGWNAEKKKVTYNGVVLDITTVVYDGCAYVPIRELAAALGYEVSYDSETKSVKLSTG
ncbi:MAG: copper amine oxidase N-terminal domain-containing protein [Eubacterium sp.]|nr:copper amine oxidase N-terminal domain-containing protein [Eubacterium sp.]